jgi:putative transposase
VLVTSCPESGPAHRFGVRVRRAIGGGLNAKSRFTDEQKIAILQQATAGTPVRALCRKHGITEQTFYRWRGKLDGIRVADAKRLRALKDENRRLRAPKSPRSYRACPTRNVRCRFR